MDKLKTLWRKQWFKNAVFFGALSLIYFTDIPLWVNVQFTKWQLSTPEHVVPISDEGQTIYRFNTLVELPDGSTKPLSSFKGKPVFLSFWASWCAPCLAEFSAFENLAGRFPGTEFVMINLEDEKSFQKYIQKTGHELHFYRLTSPIPAELGHQAIPTTFILNETGQVIFKHYGAADWSDSGVIHKLKSMLK